jgi:hypothetical protein
LLITKDISIGLTQKQLQYESIKAQKDYCITKHKNHFMDGKDNASVILSDK